MKKRAPAQKKVITIDAYNKIMDKIIKKRAPIGETMEKLLYEASKYTLKV